jgi:hypothetical protein
MPRAVLGRRGMGKQRKEHVQPQPKIQLVKEEKIAEQPENKSEQERMVTISGGVEMIVTHLDGSKETVKVRQIPATKIETFMSKLVDESTSVSIYCDKPQEWADTLTQQSIDDICEKGFEINESFLNAWCRRRAKWTEMLNVGVIADLQKKLTALNDLLASVSSAQKLPITIDLPQKK